MGTKLSGLSRDLIIHPGETLRELIEDRNMTQKELAVRTGFSEKHVSKVLNGKASITSKFAAALEIIFDVNAMFWLNLQDNYDLELMDYEALYTVTNTEISILSELKKIIEYMKSCGYLKSGLDKKEDVLQLRKILSVNSLTTIPLLNFTAAFRGSNVHKVNVYVLFAWIRLCEIIADRREAVKALNLPKLKESIPHIKNLMFEDTTMLRLRLEHIFAECGIKLCIVKHFTGAPVQGFIEHSNSGDLILCMTIRGAWADIFWFTLFHEIAHILNEDISNRFIDYSFAESEMENRANEFAKNMLINPDNYALFKKAADFSLEAIKNFAKLEQVKPYIIIGRLQKENLITYNSYYATEKIRYKWAEE